MKIFHAILCGCAGLAVAAWAEDLKTLGGETYSNIVVRQYDNANLYPIIYEVNKTAIGPNMDILKVGMVLDIPVKPEK